MIKIWYALKCPKKSEQDCTEIYEKLTDSGRLKEVISFEYQRMMRYGGGWHMERKKLLPGWIFLSGVRPEELKRSKYRKTIRRSKIRIIRVWNKYKNKNRRDKA